MTDEEKELVERIEIEALLRPLIHRDGTTVQDLVPGDMAIALCAIIRRQEANWERLKERARYMRSTTYAKHRPLYLRAIDDVLTMMAELEQDNPE